MWDKTSSCQVQEETVIKFYDLLRDYGKSSVEKLEQREKELLETRKRQQSELLREADLLSQQMKMNLVSHMNSFYHAKQSSKAKQERISRMRRAKSVGKLENEEVRNREFFIAYLLTP